MLIGLTNRREFIAALGGAAAWPIMTRAQPAKLPTTARQEVALRNKPN